MAALSDGIARKTLRIVRRTWVPLVWTALLVAVSALGWEQRRMKQEIQNLDWRATLANDREDANKLSLDVGIIQFLPAGIAVTLDAIEPTGAALELRGRVGNPRNVHISQLTVKFEAHRPAWEERDTWEKEGMLHMFLRKPKSQGEAFVGYVSAGGTAPFRVILPSIGATPRDSLELRVTLSGERYSFD